MVSKQQKKTPPTNTTENTTQKLNISINSWGAFCCRRAAIFHRLMGWTNCTALFCWLQMEQLSSCCLHAADLHWAVWSSSPPQFSPALTDTCGRDWIKFLVQIGCGSASLAALVRKGCRWLWIPSAEEEESHGFDLVKLPLKNKSSKYIQHVKILLALVCCPTELRGGLEKQRVSAHICCTHCCTELWWISAHLRCWWSQSCRALSCISFHCCLQIWALHLWSQTLEIQEVFLSLLRHLSLIFTPGV